MSPEHFNANSTEEESSSQPPPLVDKDSSDVEKKKSGESKESHYSPIKAWGDFFQRNPPSPQGWFNLIVAVFTAATCLVTYWQYTAQLVDQRAWLAVESVGADPPIPEVGQTFHIKVVFRNSGKTPAREVFTNAVVDPVAILGGPNFSYQGEKIARLGMIAPNGTSFATLRPVMSRSTGQERPLTPELLAALQKDDLRLYVHGHVSYADIFEECHWMDFCFYLLAPDFTSFAVCPNHNDTGDEKCEDEHK